MPSAHRMLRAPVVPVSVTGLALPATIASSVAAYAQQRNVIQGDTAACGFITNYELDVLRWPLCPGAVPVVSTDRSVLRGSCVLSNASYDYTTQLYSAADIAPGVVDFRIFFNPHLRHVNYATGKPFVLIPSSLLQYLMHLKYLVTVLNGQTNQSSSSSSQQEWPRRLAQDPRATPGQQNPSSADANVLPFSHYWVGFLDTLKLGLRVHPDAMCCYASRNAGCSQWFHVSQLLQ